MKMHKVIAGAAFAASLFLVSSPAFAQDNQAPVCTDGYYEDHQQGQYADIGIFLDEYCYDPDGDPVYINYISWPSWSGYGMNYGTVYMIGGGIEVIPVQVSDGQGNITSFNWTVQRYGY